MKLFTIMQGFVAYILIICVAFLELDIVKSALTSSNATFDVTKFGALGDGKTNDAKVIYAYFIYYIHMNYLF